MPLQNFVARRLPAISAVWLNAVDVLKFTVFADAATKAAARTALQLDPQLVAEGVDSGAANAAVVTLNGPITGYVRAIGSKVSFVAAATNTGAATLNVNATGAAAVLAQDGTACTGGELSLPVIVEWTGTSWRIVGGGIPLANRRTAAEITLAVIPSNYSIPSHLAVGLVIPTRYGAVSDASTNSATAVQNAYNVAEQARCPVYLGGGLGYLCNTNINVPVGQGNEVDTIGSGWANGGILFSGAGVTTGLTFDGTGYSYAGTIRDLRIRGQSGAVRGMTFQDVNHPRVERCWIDTFAGAGAYFDTTLMAFFAHNLLTNCGSATEGSVETDGVSTTFQWLHSRISGGNTTVGGLIINRTFNVTIFGGAIESCGVPIKIGNKTEAARGCVGGTIHGIDMENPGNNNRYIDMGAGLSGSAIISAYDIRGCNGSPSGTTTVTDAVRFNQCIGIELAANNWAVSNGTTTHELTSTTNLGILIRPHRNLFGAAFPWVRVNGVMINSAGPHLDFSSDRVPIGLSQSSIVSLTGATPSILINANQGGFYRQAQMNNGGATTVTALTGGTRGMEIYLYAPNGNTTLTFSAAVADQFNTLAGVNLLMVAGRFYHFVHNGTLWVEV